MPQRRTHRNPIITIILLLLIAASALVIVKVFVDRQNAETTTEQNETVNTPETKPTADQTTKEETKVTPTQNDGEDPNDLVSLTGNLTTNRVSNGKLILRVNINQYLSAGTCTLTLTSGSNIITKTANIVAVASTSTCEGFDIPVSELSSGSWKININIKSGDKSGIITGEQNI